MAIHKTVFYTPDRRIRITADPAATVFTVERDGEFLRRFAGLPALEQYITEELGVKLADLLED